MARTKQTAAGNPRVNEPTPKKIVLGKRTPENAGETLCRGCTNAMNGEEVFHPISHFVKFTVFCKKFEWCNIQLGHHIKIEDFEGERTCKLCQKLERIYSLSDNYCTKKQKTKHQPGKYCLTSFILLKMIIFQLYSQKKFH